MILFRSHRRRLAAILAAAAVTMSVIGPPATLGAPREAPAEPEISAEWVGYCNDPVWREYYTGNQNSSPTLDRSGASADIKIGFGFDPCLANQGDPFGGVAAYVELSPRTQPAACGSKGCAIRLGYAECYQVTMNGCEGDGDPYFMYQLLHCGHNDILTGVVDLGDAPYNTFNTFTMYQNVNRDLELRINGSLKAVIADTDTRVSCWLDTTLTKAVFVGKSLDPGDSLGNYPDTGVYFRNSRYGVLNRGWFNPLWGTGGCTYVTPGDTCYGFNGDDMNLSTH